MTGSILSPSWYRVAKLRPRLRSHVQIHRHRYRGEIWYVLQDHVSGRFHRFSPLAYAFIGLLDGRRTVDEIWRALCDRHGDEAPTQEEATTLLAQLHAADALVTGADSDVDELMGRAEKRERNRRLGYWRNPLALRVPLIDPDRLLDRLVPLARILFTRVGFVLWSLVVGAAVVQAAVHWEELTTGVADRVLALENILLLALVFPLVKVLHELGHGLAVKCRGGEVHELGIMFLVLFPTPYVDASAASAFRERRARIIVGAAGMLVELFVAALAMFVWVEVQPGPVRAIAFNTMLIAGVSTLMFNGNPLLRYDAYYMLMDWLEIPNLATRSNRYLGYLAHRYAFGLADTPTPVTARGEAPWFVFYSLASFAYRMFVIALIAILVASHYFVIGVLLAAWGIGQSVVWPAAKQLAYLVTGERLASCRPRALLAAGMAVAVVVAIVGAVPMPHRTLAQGVIWTPEESWVRTETEGVVADVLVDPGQQVTNGTPLLRLEDPVLDARVDILRARLREIDARYDAALAADRVAAATLRAEQSLARERLADAEARQAELLVTSPATGTVLFPQSPADLPGQFMPRGEALAYVSSQSRLTARVVVPQEKVDLVRQRTGRVHVRLAEDIGVAIGADIVREVPGATAALPSDALSLAGGGEIATDPRSADGDAAFQSLFVFDIELDSPPPESPRLGGRVYVRFDHGPEPLASRWYRQLRQLLLERLHV